MTKSFKIGQTSLEVCQTIVNNHPEISQIDLILHKVGDNWREVNKSNLGKLKNIPESLFHSKPIIKQSFSRDKFLHLSLKHLKTSNQNEVWSIISKVKYSKKMYHLPMMNFHLECGTITDIKKFLKYLFGKRKGVLLESGRYYHYYGDYLIKEKEWDKFLANFLMPCILVSPRYIGHRLYDGYCTLRLTAEKKYKPKIPRVIQVF